VDEAGSENPFSSVVDESMDSAVTGDLKNDMDETIPSIEVEINQVEEEKKADPKPKLGESTPTRSSITSRVDPPSTQNRKTKSSISP
jgi:hypothetical protein